METLTSYLSSGAVVVTATRQQAAHWRWRYAQRQVDGGLSAWRSPEVHLLSGWLEQAWEHSLLAGGIGARHRLLNRTQSRRLWSAVVGADLEPGGPLLDLVDQAWRTLNDWDIALQAVGARGAGTDAERFQRWAARYQDRCHQGGWLDSVVAISVDHLSRCVEVAASGVIPSEPH